MRDFYLGWVLEGYENQRGLVPLLRVKVEQVVYIWHVLLGILLTIPLVSLCRLSDWRRILLPGGCVLMCAAALAAGIWTNSHYFAPAVGAAILVVIQGMRRLHIATRRATFMGRLLLPSILVAQLLFLLVSTCLHAVGHPAEWAAARVRMISELGDLPGPHLVFVQYSANHSPHDEWVYNEADIDGSHVVWARCLDAAADKRLLEYFGQRRAWLVLADESTPRLRPYRSPVPKTDDP